MKRISSFILVFFLIVAGPIYAQKASSEEEANILNAIQKMLKVEAVRIDSPAIQKIFTAAFYEVNLKRQPSPRASYGMGRFKLAKVGDTFIEIEQTSTNKSLPGLQSTIRKDFKLKSQEDAEILQQALDRLFKITSSTDRKVKAFINKGDEWIFVRGKFFKKKKGFIFKVSGGTITEVSYSLGIIIDN